MKTYNAISHSYEEFLDVMYILLNDGDTLARAYAIEDTPSGMSVMYDEHGNATGLEIYDFSDKVAKGGTSIEVDAQDPFVVTW